MALSGDASASELDGWGLPECPRNSYILLRHGQSRANELGIIVSDRVRDPSPLTHLLAHDTPLRQTRSRS